MRLSTHLMQKMSINSLLDQQNKLNKTQLQLASGKKVLTPSDDPIAAARSVDLQEELRKQEQFQDNITVATHRLSLEEATLASTTDIVQRVRELAVQANNQAVLRPEDKTVIAKEVRQLLDEMVGLANTKDANGEYLFAGFKSDTQPYPNAPSSAQPPFYEFQGDANQRMLQISATRRLADGDSGQTVFEDIPTEGDYADATGNKDNLFNIVYHFALALEGNPADNDTNTANGVPETADDFLNSTLANLDHALERITEVRASVGARLNVLDQQRQVNEQFALEIKTTLSQTQDLDYAEAIGRFNSEQIALQAAQQSYIKVQGLSLFNYLR
ncbi:MAG: hypothetical protein AXA67_03975 [Methylothermaceae bacteria B42]|nr:MAG: hypothetical protein AXA67_03975 [Methylothermaceae bacteria B42]HHJ38602.1 flagellar hook-associated protein 3 [Methylothermaceae bacterium]